MKRFTMQQKVLWSLALAAVVGYLGLLVFVENPRSTQVVGEDAGSAVRSDFALIDHTGAPRADDDFRGKWLLVFFGFTHCPDVCPTGLADMGSAMDELGPQAAAVQPLFITVDPERDTPETLAEYVPAFHPTLLGLTGSPEAIAQAADAYRVYYERMPDDVAPDGYEMGHTSAIQLIDPDGAFVRVYSSDTPVDEIVADLRSRMGADT